MSPNTHVARQPDLGQTRFLTGEAVHVEVRVARLGSRVMAKLIDIFVQVALIPVVFFGLVMVTLLLTTTGLVATDMAYSQTLWLVSSIVALLGYPIALETLTRGRTMGKLVMGLRVVREDGGPISFRHALSRNLVGAALEWPGFIAAPLTWLATIWTMTVSRRSKRIGDHVAGTVVVHERTPAAWGWVPSMPAGLAAWAATLDLTGLDDDLALAVRHYLARNRQLREPARTQLGTRLAQEVAACTNPPAPAGVPGWAYLAAVHAERHRRATRQLGLARARTATVWPDLAAATASPSAATALVAPYRDKGAPRQRSPKRPRSSTYLEEN